MLGLVRCLQAGPSADEAFHLDSYLAVYDPGCSSAKVLKQCVLPFGSIASATAFLRVSLALWNFISFGQCTLTNSLVWQEAVSRRTFSLLGWRISKNKLLDFSTLCKVLGVQLDLRQSGDKLRYVTNTEERVEDWSMNWMRPFAPRCEGEKLRGRLQFASSQVFGSSGGC